MLAAAVYFIIAKSLEKGWQLITADAGEPEVQGHPEFGYSCSF